ncbi:two-partner secretion domain-containing protein [Leptolyngbya sp. GGD]|uniref:two-partner secretion domain-containing protein n=1 Tax=Leptolyngbya sp. GGD TaxID=2997907 RepID=UPI00227BE3A3|nr:filamentous hemagglutinin N-terminal domain-containing protein [Leptolyngbya sp. GGD]MCY6493868.1 filamentous hemagglutinin N-terminal domain-containing protein [Leptolyngbya sp. GGD]
MTGNERLNFRLKWIAYQQALLSTTLVFTSATVQAQIIPDGTLAGESSRVVPRALGGAAIEGGAIRESNLFHSFSEFNIRNQQSVYFANPTGIQNIFTRVTGNTISNINGTLGIDGTANLFLLNPNGILFGQNARLDLRGSFVGTTANAIRFGTQGDFSATNPQAPPLLTVNPSALLFTQINPGKITSESINSAGLSPSGQALFGLRVDEGQGLFLIGGDVQIDGGNQNGGLSALGGRIELGGLAGVGEIGLTGNLQGLTYPNTVARSNISLLNNAVIQVQGNGSGDIIVNANAMESRNGSRLIAGTEGTGNSGNVVLNANQILFQGSSLDPFQGLIRGGIFTTLQPGAIGNAGSVQIATRTLTIADGATISTVTRGQGNAGNISIEARDRISITNLSDINSSVDFTGIGQGGTIQIRTPLLTLTNAGLITSTTAGQGNAGDITITADSVLLTQPSEIAQFSGGILTSTIGQGNAGEITINARDLILLDNANLSSDVLTLDLGGVFLVGTGQGGDMRVSAGTLQIANNSTLSSAVSGQGDAGNITLEVQDVLSVEESTISSSTASNVIPGLIVRGRAGDVKISARSIFLDRDAQILSSVDGQGDGGDISIRARDQLVVDAGTPRTATGISSTVLTNGTGQGGSIEITTGSLSLLNEAIIASGTLGAGNSGDIEIQARDDIQLIGSSAEQQIRGGIFLGASPAATGNSGSIRITTLGNFRVQEMSIAVNNLGGGQSANIDIEAGTALLNRAALLAETAIGTGGNITLQLQDALVLRNNSLISTTAGRAGAGGDGGNITINTGVIVAPAKENSDISANAFLGRGGNVRIQADGIFGIAARSQPTSDSDITASSELGVQGQITIVQPEVQPTQGIIELPTEILDASNQIAQICPRRIAGKQMGRFVVSGRGSNPPSPFDPLTGASIQPPAEIEAFVSSSIGVFPIELIATPIVEAQGWVRHNGQIKLVAMTELESTAASCPTPRQN